MTGRVRGWGGLHSALGCPIPATHRPTPIPTDSRPTKLRLPVVRSPYVPMPQYQKHNDQRPGGRWAKATGLGDHVPRWPDTKYSQENYWSEIWIVFFTPFIERVHSLTTPDDFKDLQFPFDRRLWESDGKSENAISRVWDSVAARLRTNIGIPLWVIPGEKRDTPPQKWKLGND